MRTLNLKNPARLTNAGAFTFMQLVLVEGEALTDECIISFINELKQKTADYGEALKLDKTSKMTSELKSTMAAMSSDYRSVRKLSSALTLSREEGLKAIAEKVCFVNSKYGDFTDLCYSDKLAKFKLWLDEVEAIGDEEITKLGIKPMVSSIRALAEKFTADYQVRNDYRDFRKGKIKQAREAVQSAYEAFVSRVEAMATLGDEKCAKIVSNICEYFVWFLMNEGSDDAPKSSGTEPAAPEAEITVNETSKEEVNKMES